MGNEEGTSQTNGEAATAGTLINLMSYLVYSNWIVNNRHQTTLHPI